LAFATSASLLAMIAILLTSVAPATASEGCSNEARREEQGAAGRALPDCRAYELVSTPNFPSPSYPHYFEGFPPVNNTYSGRPQDNPPPVVLPQSISSESIALDGNATLYGAGEFNSEGDSFYSNLSRRGPGGWKVENIAPGQSRHAFLCGYSDYVGWSRNLETVVWSAGHKENETGEVDPERCGHDEPRLVPGENEEGANLFLRDTATGSWRLVNTPPLPGTLAHDPFLDAISPDGSHVVFNSRAQLTPGAPFNEAPAGGGFHHGNPEELCGEENGDVYVSTAGAVHLVTVLPGGTPLIGSLAGSHKYDVGCWNLPVETADVTHAVSADGERILFYAGGGVEFIEPRNHFKTDAPYLHGGLYLRRHPGADQSALAHGGAFGAGTLTAGSATVSPLLAATGTANLTEGSDKLANPNTKVGEFLVGQTIAGEGIPTGTTITAHGVINYNGEEYLVLSAPVEAGKSGEGVPISATAPQPLFAAGQTIVGEGIPAGTTIAAVASGSLTLSAAATASEAATALESFSECTEPAKACSVRIDLPEGGSGSAGGGQFQWANAETTKIFFTDVEKLTADSTAQAGKPDLYEYDLEKPQGQRLTDLTANAGEPAEVLGVAGASDDGSYLYFAAQGVLTGAQQNSHGAAALGPAQGNGTLSGVAKGNGNVSGTEVTGLSVSSGEFHVGQEIQGEGIPANTTITHCSPSCSAPTELTLSQNDFIGGATELTGLGSTEVTGLSTTSGAFQVGMAISGSGIAPLSWITAVGAGTITLSKQITESGTKTLSATAANLYLRHGGATTFIATLNSQGGDRCDWTAVCLSSRVSSNGAFIAFDSIDSITGYDNHPVQPEACAYLTHVKNSPCLEAFRYAAASGAHGELTCAACNPAGPPASEFAWSVIPQASLQTTLSSIMNMAHSVSDSGQVFFDTMEKLVPTDENKTWDVYEYSGGEGPSAQLHLISSGKSEQPSYFVDATPDSSNVFFDTDQSLLRADTRSDFDLYDARVGGGFPEPPPPPLCEAEGCHPAYPGAPGNPSPGSASLEGKGNVHPAGTGNVPPAKCKKGFVKKKGKCVKQRKKKSKKAKKKKSKKAKKSIRRAAK
jgi:hypothetical protein